MDVTPVIGILAIVGLVALLVCAFALLIVMGRLATLKEGEPFFEDEERPSLEDDYDDTCSAL